MLKKPEPKSSNVIAWLVLLLVFCLIEQSASAQGKNVVDANGSAAAASSPAPTPAGILPIPDYSGDFWHNAYLTGDWGGARTDLANKGVQFEVQWHNFVQGVASGG